MPPFQIKHPHGEFKCSKYTYSVEVSYYGLADHVFSLEATVVNNLLRALLETSFVYTQVWLLHYFLHKGCFWINYYLSFQLKANKPNVSIWEANTCKAILRKNGLTLAANSHTAWLPNRRSIPPVHPSRLIYPAQRNKQRKHHQAEKKAVLVGSM